VNRQKILIGGIIVCVAVTVYAVIFKPFAPKFKAPEGGPKGIHVLCTNADCGFEDQHYDASARGRWPRTCPKCGQKTLYMPMRCPHCGELTAEPPTGYDKPSIKCIHCGKEIMLQPPMPQ